MYKLVNDIDSTFYFGSTCDSLSKRLSVHKEMSRKFPKRRVYEHFNEIGWEHVKIVLVEEYKLENKEQLRREEDKFIQLYKQDVNCLNMIHAVLNIENERQKEKEYMKEYNKSYRAQNSDRIKQHKTELMTCECGSVIQRCIHAKHCRTKKHQNLLAKNYFILQCPNA